MMHSKAILTHIGILSSNYYAIRKHITTLHKKIITKI